MINKLLSANRGEIAARIIRTARTNTRTHLTELMDAVQDEHRAIYQAIADGDPERAAMAAAEHLNNAVKRSKLYRKMPAD